MADSQLLAIVPVADPVRAFTGRKSKFLDALDRVISSKNLVLGTEVSMFETELSDYLGGTGITVGCANGTDALYLALQAANLPSGSLVATVANAGFYSPNAIFRAGHTPFYLDVSVESGLVGREAVQAAIKFGVKAVILTHLYGAPVPETLLITDECNRHDVLVIEDCAQAIGAEISGSKVGTFGAMAAFSFYPSKNLGALGDGGAVVAQHIDYANRLKSLRQYGWGEKYEVKLPGGVNSRLDEIQASFLRISLRHLDEENSERQGVARFYFDNIVNNLVSLPRQLDFSTNVWHLFVIRVHNGGRNRLQEHLLSQGVASAVHYPKSDAKVEAYKNSQNNSLEATDQRLSEILSIPMFAGMTSLEMGRVVNAINGWG